MADHSKPTNTSLYTEYTAELDARFDDLAQGLDPAVTTVTNMPTNSIRWNSANSYWEKWNGSVWAALSGGYQIDLAGARKITTNSASPALTITQTGTGDALRVEDSASPDSSPFVIDGNGVMSVQGALKVQSNLGDVLLDTIQDNKNIIFRNSVSGTPTERMSIISDGRVLVGGTLQPGRSFRVGKDITGSVDAQSINAGGTILSDVTSSTKLFSTFGSTEAASFTLPLLSHYSAGQGSFGLGSTVTNQYFFNAESSAPLATNNYGFYGNIASGTGRWNFYANGTAPNYFAGDVRTNTVLSKATTVSSSNTGAIASASSLLGGIRTGTPAANINLQMPTGTNMDAAFQDLQTNQAIEWSLINLAAATHIITVTAGADHTLVGNMQVQANSSGRFATRKTAANTFITYRLG